MIVGLTGGIACGKSAVTSRLRTRRTVDVVDLDELARRVVEPGRRAYHRIKQQFGDKVILADGTLDREAIGERIFSDPHARRALNSATHLPILWELLLDVAAAKAAGSRLIVLDAPLLFESSLHLLCHTTVVVHVSSETQLERLQERDGRSRDEAEQRVNSQMPLAHKVGRADVLIDNNGQSEATDRLVDELASRLEAAAAVWSLRHALRDALLAILLNVVLVVSGMSRRLS